MIKIVCDNCGDSMDENEQILPMFGSADIELTNVTVHVYIGIQKPESIKSLDLCSVCTRIVLDNFDLYSISFERNTFNADSEETSPAEDTNRKIIAGPEFRNEVPHAY